MAEYLLRTKIKKNKIKWWDVSSCGIRAEVGGTISQNSKIALEKVGINVDKFTSKQLNQKMIEKSVLVVCMTESQKVMLEACGNVCCVKDLCGYDVPDPYGRSLDAYEMTRDILSKACDNIINDYIKNYKEE